MHHFITIYSESGMWYAEAWLQVNLFGRCLCFSKKRIKLPQTRQPYN